MWLLKRAGTTKAGHLVWVPLLLAVVSPIIVACLPTATK
jgi:hypothetical protein